MKEPWYATLMLGVAGSLALIISGLALVEILTAHRLREAPPARWTAALERMDAAIARGDLPDAARHWRDAHEAALGSRQWEPLIDVGDGYRRLGRAADFGPSAHGGARDSYVNALMRARRDGSLDGVLRAAESLAALGDGALVEHCLRVARELARSDVDPMAAKRVASFADRLAVRTAGPEPVRAMWRP
jgi:hypothetical protein